jgi:hypothetical protein
MTTESSKTPAEMQNLLESMVLDACTCTDTTSFRECPAYKRAEPLMEYIRSLEQQVVALTIIRESTARHMKTQDEKIAYLGKEHASLKSMLETCRDVTDDIYNDPLRLDTEHDIIDDYKWRCVKLKDQINRTLSSLYPAQ